MAIPSSNLSTPLLELCGVSHRAGETTILADISWRVEARQHWTVVGPNGAGKTTLLRIACGYLWPNAGGVVKRLGQPLNDLRELRQSMGWVDWQLASQVPRREQALDTVVSGRLGQVGLRHMLEPVHVAPADYEAAAAVLDRLGCGELAARYFGQLSQGEQQVVLLARACMARPWLLFLDEPCAGLDPGMRERFLGVVQRLADDAAGPTLVMVSHHLQEIVPPLDQVLVLEQGRCTDAGLLGEVLDRERIERLYGVELEQLIQQNGRLWPIWRSPPPAI